MREEERKYKERKQKESHQEKKELEREERKRMQQDDGHRGRRPHRTDYSGRPKIQNDKRGHGAKSPSPRPRRRGHRDGWGKTVIHHHMDTVGLLHDLARRLRHVPRRRRSSARPAYSTNLIKVLSDQKVNGIIIPVVRQSDSTFGEGFFGRSTRYDGLRI